MGALFQYLKSIVTRPAKTESPLKLMERVTSDRASLQDMRELFQTYLRPKGEGTWDQKSIASELVSNAEADPGSITHVFTSDGKVAKVAYQLSPRDDGTYLPYLVSFEKGLGGEALEDAYLTAKGRWPNNSVYLYSTPEAEGFYDRQVLRGWKKSNEDGIPRYERKAQGGLVQMKECNCGRT